MTIVLVQWLYATLLLLAASGAAAGTESPDLYTADAIVTGQAENNRRPAFQDCLREVVVRVSGDQRLLGRPELERRLSDAGDYVSHFRYRDRLQGMPVHDDQGTYDRPYDLVCSFDRTKVDGLLALLGSRPWLAARPRLAVFLAVEAPGGRFTLASDGSGNPYMTESFLAQAASLALEIVIPDGVALAEAGLDFDETLTARPGRLEAAAEKIAEGSRALAGRLVWNDDEREWVADWRLSVEGRTVWWQASSINFDAAFRNAMRGAAQIMSGNGLPQ